MDPNNLNNVISAVWFTTPGHDFFRLDLNFGADNEPHQLAVYCAAYDGQARSQFVRILDGDTLSVLKEQPLKNFDTGVYLVWRVSRHVVIEVANNKTDPTIVPPSPNAVISGIFFD